MLTIVSTLSRRKDEVKVLADFTAPFHAPKFTNEEFEARKAAYVEKYGYSITVPSIGDIIHLKAFVPMTDEEKKLWTERRYDEIEPGRRSDIEEEKYRKKQKYLAMLADPSPKIARDVAGILTALDDIQDAVSTLACVCMIGAAIVGGTTAAAVLGPIGLILGASTLLNLINPMSHINKPFKFVSTGRAAKRKLEKQTDKNPFSKKAKLKLAKRIRMFRPSIGNLLEALQVTDNIFGVGISLGPIVGFAQATASGMIRTGMGEDVTIRMKKTRDPDYLTPAARIAIANSFYHSYDWQSDVSDETMSIYAASMMMQVLYESVQEWNPFEEVTDIGSYLVECPQPSDPLTIEILQEEGFDFETGCVWPQNGERLISISDLQRSVYLKATANLRTYGTKNNHSLEAFNALTAADDFALNFLAACESPEQIVIDYLRIQRIVITILDNGWVYPEDITDAQIRKFEEWCYVHDYMNTQPTGKEIFYYAEVFCGFTWERSAYELR